MDGILDESATEMREVSLSAARTLTYEMTGMPSDIKTLEIRVRSIKTNKSDSYIKINVDFTGDAPVQSEVSRNSKVFNELS